MATVEVDGGQVPLEIVHWKTFVPVLSAVIPVVGDVGVIIVPPPDTNVHKPVPTTGVLPVIVAVAKHNVCVLPALARVGVWSLMIATVDAEVGHGPLLMVHWKTLVPVASAVIPLFGKAGDVITPEPDTSVQEPVPIAGVFPLSVAVLTHTF